MRPIKMSGTSSPIRLRLHSRNPMAMVAGLAILVLCVAGYFIFQGTKGDSGASDYQQLMTKVGRLTDADAQEKLLMDLRQTWGEAVDLNKKEMAFNRIARSQSLAGQAPAGQPATVEPDGYRPFAISR